MALRKADVEEAGGKNQAPQGREHGGLQATFKEGLGRQVLSSTIREGLPGWGAAPGR